MISQETADKVVAEMVDWATPAGKKKPDKYTLDDLLVLVDRIRRVKGNTSFGDTMTLIYSKLKDYCE